jgi:CHAT domain-containing protein
MTLAPSVFISHASADHDAADAICAALEHHGIQCWIASRDIAPGQNFGEAITTAIHNSRVMVLIFSSKANNSDEIKKEVVLAGRYRVPIIPVRMEDVQPSGAFEYELVTRQWVDFFRDWDKAIERLIGQLRQLSTLEATAIAEAEDGGRQQVLYPPSSNYTPDCAAAPVSSVQSEPLEARTTQSFARPSAHANESGTLERCPANAIHDQPLAKVENEIVSGDQATRRAFRRSKIRWLAIIAAACFAAFLSASYWGHNIYPAMEKIERSLALMFLFNGHGSPSDASRTVEELGETMPGSPAYAQALLILASRLALDQNSDRAMAACREARQTLEGAGVGIEADALQPCLTILETEAENGKEPAAQEMFLFAQLAQGRITRQQISFTDARLPINKRDPRILKLRQERDDINSEIATLYVQNSGKNDAARISTAAQIAADEARRAVIERTLQFDFPKYDQLIQRVVHSDDILRSLRPGEAFVQTVLCKDRGWVFLLRDGSIKIAPIIGGSTTIERLVSRVRKSLDAETQPPLPFDADAAFLLYKQLFGGVADGMADATALSVVPYGPLQSLPFGILLTGRTDPEKLSTAPWLIRTVAVEHVPSAANFLNLRKRATSSRATRPWFGFGTSTKISLAQAEATFPLSSCRDIVDWLANSTPEPGERRELEGVRRIFGAAVSDQLLDESLTIRTLKQIDLNNYRVLHFVTHLLASSDLGCQSEPALIFSPPAGAKTADDALLTSTDVASLNLDADIVILSSVGIRGSGGGESINGLARSFFYAGARSLLVQHWSTNDRVTAYIVASTVAAQKSDPTLGVASALAAVQRKILDDAKGDMRIEAHPFYWGSLAVVGEAKSGE